MQKVYFQKLYVIFITRGNFNNRLKVELSKYC